MEAATTPSGSRVRPWLLALLISAVVLVGAVATAEGLTRQRMKNGDYRQSSGENWFDTWEYVTIFDPRTGIALRPNIESRWTDVDIRINRSGVRDSVRERTVGPRQDGEFLVLVLGDSNAFGNGLPFERAYPARLEQGLARGTGRRVRVVNLGVSSYTNLQAKLHLERWLHLAPDAIVFADCFNNRAFEIGAPETEDSLAELHRSYRVWELGEWISYTLLWANKQWNPIVFETPELNGELPAVRLPPNRYLEVLEDVVRLARESDAALVFLGTGDHPQAAALAARGLTELDREQWARAAATFEGFVRAQPHWFLGWHYLHRARSGLGRGVAELREAYGSTRVATTYRHRFARFADEYLPLMHAAAEAGRVPMVDVRGRFRAERVHFGDICHFDDRGHAIVAEELTRVLAQKIGDLPAARSRGADG